MAAAIRLGHSSSRQASEGDQGGEKAEQEVKEEGQLSRSNSMCLAIGLHKGKHAHTHTHTKKETEPEICCKYTHHKYVHRAHSLRSVTNVIGLREMLGHLQLSGLFLVRG